MSSSSVSQVTVHVLHKSSGGGPPAGAIQCGLEGGNLPQWGIVAHTQWGNIPGKFNSAGCFYPYGGEEKSTNDFSFISVPTGWHLEKSSGSPPVAGLKVGFQNVDPGSGDYWLAVAHSQYGDVPGKARGGDCWFPYAGKEHSTNNFSWVVVNPGPQLQKHSGGGAPAGAIQCGLEGGNLPQWGIVAHTQWGNIPGKFNSAGCFFPYGGEEKSTSDFSFIIALGGWRLEKQHHPPMHALKVGFQNVDPGSGDYWLAVAHSQFGDVPGKAKGGECWFPFRGKEHVTRDFSWVVAK